MKSTRYSIWMVILTAAFLFSGCAGSNDYMKEVAGNAVNTAPDPQQASVVFMRPSTFGFAISSSVFDIEGDTNTYIGIVSAKKKIVYKTRPGEHLFMVIGESADFMKADLAPGKVYYALVTPRMGAWKARFSLKPVDKTELSTPDFSGWVGDCTYTENTEGAYAWAKENAASIQQKKAEYLPKWYEKAEADRPFLKPEDGM